jgi:hypothetical protein
VAISGRPQASLPAPLCHLRKAEEGSPHKPKKAPAVADAFSFSVRVHVNSLSIGTAGFSGYFDQFKIEQKQNQQKNA